MPIKDFGGN